MAPPINIAIPRTFWTGSMPGSVPTTPRVWSTYNCTVYDWATTEEIATRAAAYIFADGGSAFNGDTRADCSVSDGSNGRLRTHLRMLLDYLGVTWINQQKQNPDGSIYYVTRVYTNELNAIVSGFSDPFGTGLSLVTSETEYMREAFLASVIESEGGAVNSGKIQDDNKGYRRTELVRICNAIDTALGINMNAQNPQGMADSSGTVTVTPSQLNLVPLPLLDNGRFPGTTRTSYANWPGAARASGGDTAPDAQFTGAPTTIAAGSTVTFSNQSTGTIGTYEWDFEYNGSTFTVDTTTTNLNNVTYTYNTPGTYSVRMRATNSVGSDVLLRSGYITVNAGGSAPVAEFTGTPLSFTVPQVVTFSNFTTGGATSYEWDFAYNGITFNPMTTTTSSNPVTYNYTVAGTYSVALRATNAYGSNTRFRTAYITASSAGTAPTADFTGSPLTGNSPMTVTFTNTSTGGGTTFEWDFSYDGTFNPMLTTNNTNPVTYQYTSIGVFSVAMRATNTSGSNTRIRSNYITVSQTPSLTYRDRVRGVVRIMNADGGSYTAAAVTNEGQVDLTMYGQKSGTHWILGYSGDVTTEVGNIGGNQWAPTGGDASPDGTSVVFSGKSGTWIGTSPWSTNASDVRWQPLTKGYGGVGGCYGIYYPKDKTLRFIETENDWGVTTFAHGRSTRQKGVDWNPVWIGADNTDGVNAATNRFFGGSNGNSEARGVAPSVTRPGSYLLASSNGAGILLTDAFDFDLARANVEVNFNDNTDGVSAGECFNYIDFRDGSNNQVLLGVCTNGIFSSVGGTQVVRRFQYSANTKRAITIRNGAVIWVLIPNLGIYRSLNYGINWTLWFTRSASGSTNQIHMGSMAYDSSTDTLWAAFDNGGAYRVNNATSAAVLEGNPPTGATRITTGLPASTTIISPIDYDVHRDWLWGIQQYKAGNSRNYLWFMPIDELTWYRWDDTIFEEGTILPFTMVAHDGFVWVSTNGQGVVRLWS